MYTILEFTEFDDTYFIEFCMTFHLHSILEFDRRLKNVRDSSITYPQFIQEYLTALRLLYYTRAICFLLLKMFRTLLLPDLRFGLFPSSNSKVLFNELSDMLTLYFKLTVRRFYISLIQLKF